MRGIILRRLAPAAALLLMLLFLPGRVDAAGVIYEPGTETVYQNGQRFPAVPNTYVRQARSVRHVHRHHRGRSQGSGVTALAGDGGNYGPVSVPDSGSTLAMLGSAALLLLGYDRLGCKRIAA